MCRPWNKPRQGYPELERLRLQLRRRQPELYLHLANRYFNYTTRRILTCANPTCTITYPAWATINFHTHGRKHHPLIPRIQRITPLVDDRLVTQAINWLDTHWHGEPFLPDELKADNAKRKVAA